MCPHYDAGTFAQLTLLTQDDRVRCPNPEGVPLDTLQVYLWLTLATKQNNKDAERQRARVASKLTSDEVLKVEQTALTWKPKQSAKKKPAAR